MRFNKLLIPVESQVREFDAKLLLSCVAAESGFEAIIGSRAHIHHYASRIRGCVYIAKSMRQISKRMFSIINQLGHKIVAWDEESLVRLPDAEYYSNRLSPDTFKRIEHLFAWGENDADVFRNYPFYQNQPVHVFGNPRVDILRPELKNYFQQHVDSIHNNFGNFILINTNFNSVNHFLPDLDQASNKSRFIHERLKHKKALLDEFILAITTLSNSFPNYNFVVRPHPSENILFWKDKVGKNNNVYVTNDGNVINWIMASNGLISNGCTTSIESTILRKPTIGYYPIKDINIDDPLPKTVSDITNNSSQLVSKINDIISDDYQFSSNSIDSLKPHIANLSGEYAVDRIIKILNENYTNEVSSSSLSLQYIKGKIHNESRTAIKKINSFKKNHINGSNFHQYRFPTLDIDTISDDVHKYANTMDRFSSVTVQQLDKHIFKLAC